MIITMARIMVSYRNNNYNNNDNNNNKNNNNKSMPEPLLAYSQMDR